MPLARDICRAEATAEEMPRLNALICASPADAAVHDAFGRAAGIDSYDGYGREHMDRDLSSQLGPTFRGRFIADFLSPLPESIDAFHLVGGFDKLSEFELGPDDPDDSLPVSLDQWIRAEGLRCLKVKLQGTDLEWDIERLLDVVRVTRAEHRHLGIEELWISADTNEMCESPDYMVELLSRLNEQDPEAFRSLLYVEQPCERDLRRRRLDVRKLAALKPVIIDEALTSLEDFDLALDLGYSGVALKTCKCQSAELVMAAKASAEGIPFAVQDLTNPGIALLHSAGLAGRLGTIRGVEANGRQFFPGASEPERRVHPRAFKLTAGRIGMRTIRGPGLGYQWEKIGRTFVT
jgi:L-alanine-DL-glutamate epimerase-like enolase superfamily enzyme